MINLLELFQILALACPDLVIIDWGMQVVYERNPLIHLSRQTMHAIRQNLAISLRVLAIAVLLTIVGIPRRSLAHCYTKYIQ